MPRIRSVKPEFWADEKIGPMPVLYRLVFLGLMSTADDAGRLVDSEKQIDAALFPYTSDTCVDALAALASAGRIERGESESGQRIIQIVNWERHQKIDKPSKYNLPPIIRRDSRETPANVPRDPLATILDLGSSTPDQRAPSSAAREGREVGERPKPPNGQLPDGFDEIGQHLTPLGRTALAGFCRAAQQPFTIIGVVNGLHEVNGFAWPIVSQALVEYAADANTRGFNSRGLRAFCQALKTTTAPGKTEGDRFLEMGAST